MPGLSEPRFLLIIRNLSVHVKRKKKVRLILETIAVVFILIFILITPILSQEELPAEESQAEESQAEESQTEESKENGTQTVEINGDEVEFSVEDNKFYAKGNVVIIRGKMTLEADEVVYDRNSQIAVAEGNVILTMEQGTIRGEKLTYNYIAMEGEFMGAHFYSHPYYGRGASLTKVDENKIVMENGYITTSDFDKPEWRLVSKRIEIYPGEKAVARHMRMLVGEVPILYIPRFTQNLKEKKPVYEITPGHTKDWGTFVLTSWFFRLECNLL